MTAFDWAAIGYGVVGLLMWRPVGRWYAEDRPTKDWGDAFELLVFTTITVVVWGLWIIPNLIYRGFAGDAQRFQYLLVGEGRKAKAKRQADRIRELEKELDLQ